MKEFLSLRTVQEISNIKAFISALELDSAHSDLQIKLFLSSIPIYETSVRTSRCDDKNAISCNGNTSIIKSVIYIPSDNENDNDDCYIVKRVSSK